MDRELKILFVEDSETDAELIIREISKKQYHIRQSGGRDSGRLS